MTDREHKIRQRAYDIWEKEGHPHGREQEHWHRAAREVEAPSPEAGAAEPGVAAAAAPEPAEKPAPKRRKAAAATTAAAPRKRTVKKS